MSDERHAIVLDNTYVTGKSRAGVIQVAAELGVPIRCVWLTTGIDDAQVNAVTRLVARYGKLPGDSELSRLRKTDVAAFPPTVLFRYQRELEPPDVSEGFSRIDVVPFDAPGDPAHVNRAVIVWCDDPAQLEALAPPCARIRTRAGDSACCRGNHRSPTARAPTPRCGRCSRAVDRARRPAIDVDFCPHGAGPPRCWCRKPLPGLGVPLIHRHQLDPVRCLYIGAGSQDAGFARKLGFRHVPTLTASA